MVRVIGGCSNQSLNCYSNTIILCMIIITRNLVHTGKYTIVLNAYTFTTMIFGYSAALCEQFDDIFVMLTYHIR